MFVLVLVASTTYSVAMNQVYPPSLIEPLRKAWKSQHVWPKSRRPPLPDDTALLSLLATIYHASLLQEEGRKLEFRVIAYPRKSLSESKSKVYQEEQRFALFSEPRDFSLAELRRLAPAAESVRSIICVDLDEQSRWQIWGLLDTGANWWEFIHHEASGGRPPPQFLTISSISAGELSASSGGHVMLTLRNGAVHFPQSNLFFEGPISDYLDPIRKALYGDIIKALDETKFDHDGADNEFPQRFFNMCLSRILNCIVRRGHGGTVLLVPDYLSATDSRLADRVTIKHACAYNYVWSLMVRSLELHRRYYDLYFPLWDAPKSIKRADYRAISLLDSKREETDEALADCFQFIAALASVDGAVVLSHRLRVLGFGAEVIALSPTLKQIKLAMDARGRKTRDVTIEAYGTRHRSAFRFCSSYEEAVAFVVSQDGGTKAVKRVGSDILMWPDVTTIW